jgi:choice-of-anchor B domain-containing protein
MTNATFHGMVGLMRIALCTALLLPFSASAQLNMNLLGQLGYSEDLSDIWGWHNPADGKEYALVGVNDGFSIADVSDPTNPVELHFVPGTSTIWRDVKTWGNYAYVVNEGGGGLLIVDMSGLPGSITTYTWTGGVGYSTAHNIFMDENGIAYLCGSNGSLGTLFLDCAANPTDPPIVGSYTLRYVHDLFVRGDTMWTGEINDGIFSVVDVSDKTAPSVLATQATTSDFTHATWMSDDGSTLFTVDEVSAAFMDAYDVTDLSDIRRLDTWQSNPGSGVIPHNIFVLDNHVVTSYYRDGFTVTDVTYPDNMIQTGFYDSSPFSGDGFNGAWGVYPYLPSGNVIGTDIEEGLICLNVTYAQAAYLRGVVTDSVTGTPIPGATVEILAVPDADPESTDILGAYATGTAYPGTYTVEVSAFGYASKSFPATALSEGVETILNAELAPLPTFDLAGAVLDSISGQPIPFARVLLELDGVEYALTADALGQFSQPGLVAGDYTVFSGSWGWNTKQFGPLNLSPGGAPLVLEINRGWYDDFLFDFNWNATATGGTATGFWVREVPVGTFSGPSPVNPDEDAFGDFGELAYITGNGGGGAGTDDVDDGVVRLSSQPFDISYMGAPRILFREYFYSGGGFGTPDDTLFFRISDGTTTEIVQQRNPGSSTFGWFGVDVPVPSSIDRSLPLTFEVQTADRPDGDGHLVEAGIDHWRIVDDAITGAPQAALDQDPFCAGEPIQFLDNSDGFPGSWSWTFEDGTPAASIDRNPLVSFPGPGTYTVTLTVYNGVATNSTSTSITIGAPLELNLSATASTTGSDGSATVDAISGGVAPFDYLWDDPAASTSATAAGLAPGLYTCVVTDANGCSQSDTVRVSGAVGLAVPQQASPTWGQNPFAAQTQVHVPGSAALTWEAFDALGRSVASGIWNPGTHAFGEGWAAGSYQIRWTREDGTGGVQSLIKQRP